MMPPKPRSLAAWAWVVCVLCLAPPLHAQESPSEEAAPDGEAIAEVADEPDEPDEPALIVEGRELFAEFEAGQAELDALRVEARRASGEQLIGLNRQIGELRVDLIRIVSRLVDNVVAQDLAEIESPEQRERVEALVDRLAPAIVSHINSTSKRMARLRKRRESAEKTELLEIDQQIAAENEWGVTLFRAYADTVDDMSALGMNADEERAELEGLVSQVAETLSRRLTFLVDRERQLTSLLAEQPDDEDLKLQLASVEDRRERTVRTFSIAIRLLERLELPAAEYQQLLISSTGEVTADIFKKEVALGLVDQAFQKAELWVRENGLGYAFKAATFVLIVLAFSLLARIVRAILTRTLSSERVDASQLLKNMVSSVAGTSITLLGVLVALSQLGVELGPILAGLGIAGFIVGFALQDSLGNLASGVMILAVRPYDVGDLIEAAGVFGRVSEMSLIATTILTIDNQTLVVPNSRIWGDVIKNVTDQSERRVDMTFRIAYSEDLDRVESVLRGILEADERILDEPEPLLKVHKLNEWSVDFVVRPWVKTEDYWDVYWDLNRTVKRRFDEEAITIAVPRRDVQLLGDAERSPS